MTKINRRPALLAENTSNDQSTYNVPVWVYDVVDTDVLPVKYEYRARGYKGLRFSCLKNRITYQD